MFDFWVNLAEGLWKSKDNLISSGGTPKETSAHTVALYHILDSLIEAAIPEYSSRGIYGQNYNHPIHANTNPQGLTRVLRLLDLMALTHRIHHSGRLIASVANPEDNPLAKYQKSIIPLVPELKARYDKYNSSQLPVLDAFLRALVERWLQDFLGTPSSRPAAVIKQLACKCEDCEKINKFLRSNVVTDDPRLTDEAFAYGKLHQKYHPRRRYLYHNRAKIALRAANNENAGNVGDGQVGRAVRECTLFPLPCWDSKCTGQDNG